MASLAHMLLDAEIIADGYDKKISDAVTRLLARKSVIYQDAYDIDPLRYQIAVFSTAIDRQNHPVYKLFENNNIPLLHRSDLLQMIFKSKRGIAVAGSHGKTTTTTMIAQILIEHSDDPSIMVGGDLPFLQDRGGRFGKGEWGVFESDESDGTFSKYTPEIKIVTNIDNDHLDYYQSIDNLYNAFSDFINKSVNSFSIVSGDDPGIAMVLKNVGNSGKIIMYSEICTTKYCVKYKIQNDTLFFELNNNSYTLKLPLPGDHYLKNALAAIIACDKAGINPEKSISSLMQYKGVRRRFEYLGNNKDCRIYDDYGHHPTEIQSVISTALKLEIAPSELAIIFQPHRFTRTMELASDFARVLSGDFQVYLLPVYSAGEKPIAGIESRIIADKIQSPNLPVLLSGNISQDVELLNSSLGKFKILISLGAGDVRQWGLQLTENQ